MENATDTWLMDCVCISVKLIEWQTNSVAAAQNCSVFVLPLFTSELKGSNWFMMVQKTMAGGTKWLLATPLHELQH